MKFKTHIPIPENFSFSEILSFLDRGYDDCLYHLTQNSVTRLVQFDTGYGLISISKNMDDLIVEIHKKQVSDQDVVYAKSYVQDWFDLKNDIEPFYQLLKKHPALSEFPNRFAGARLVGIPDLFEALCWAIIGQQINLPFAYQVKRNLVERYGYSEVYHQQKYYLFPTPDVLIEADDTVLSKLKFSRQKIKYIKNVSQSFLEHKVSKAILLNCEDRQEQMDKLIEIKGIGIWSANYAMMKSIRDPSCITYGDAGLNRALFQLFDTEKRPNKAIVDKIFSDFEGWESYLNFYLWKSI